MRKLLKITLAITSITSLPAMASTDGSYLDSDMYNSATMNNVQVNNSGTPTTTIDNIQCPTASFTFGGGQIQADSVYYRRHLNSTTATVGFQMPIDINGTVDRCIQAQKAAVATRKFTYQMNVVKNCIAAAKAGLYLDPKQFPWAKMCTGVQKKYEPRYNWQPQVQRVSEGFTPLPKPKAQKVSATTQVKPLPAPKNKITKINGKN